MHLTCTYETVGETLRDSEVIHFIDNTAALSNSIKGSAKQADCARIVCSTHLAIARSRIVPWFAYVASKANVSDLPSRGLMAEMMEALDEAVPGSSARANSVEVKFPGQDAWAAAAIAAAPPSPNRKRPRRGRKR